MTSCASSSDTTSGNGAQATTTSSGGSGGQPSVGGSGVGAAGGGTGGDGGSQGGSGGDGGCSPLASLDPSFGVSGVQQIAMVGMPGGTSSDLDRDYGRTIALAPTGEIVFAGEWYDGSSYDFALVRLTATGGLDSSFGTGGKVTQHGFSASAPLRGVVIDGSGHVIVAGALSSFGGNYAIARLTSLGAPSPRNHILN